MANYYVIIGLGDTGLSCAQYLMSVGISFVMMDTRIQPPHLDNFKKTFVNVPLILGKLDTTILEKASAIILSPGIALQTPEILAQQKRGIPIIGDIELLAKAITSPVIAITGTNAKSTVTTLVGEMATKMGLQAQVGGNLGVPALDLFMQQPKADLYVLELSSFQLETTYSLKSAVATILNITPDHMDRYATLAAYQQAKHRIYHDCEVAIINRDDKLTYSHDKHARQFYFTLDSPAEHEFGLMIDKQECYLAYEDHRLLSVRELPILGKHYYANALAALAIGHGYGWAMESMLQVLREFRGLPHRCQFVHEAQGVKWYNDSKGTNVGATCAAIEGLGSAVQGKLVLIAGGVGKNADFHPLLPFIQKYVSHVVLIGEAAKEIANCLMESPSPFSFAASMVEAIQQAEKVALSGDAILLSPACASFDMFKNYEHRGNVFMQLVAEKFCT